jgi:hypothetical protein
MRSLIAHGFLLVFAVVLAWSVAERDPSPKDAAETVVLEGKRLVRASLVTPAGTVAVEPHERDATALPTVHLTRMVVDETVAPRPSAPVDASNDAGAPDEELPMISKTFRFPGGSTVTRAIEGLFPLKARRVLTDVPTERLVAMGLDSPKSTLTLVVDAVEHVYDVGEKTYGNTARYLKKRGESRVFLVDNNAISGLEGTETKLSERRLVTEALENVTLLSLKVDDRERAFTHQEREQAKKRYFAPVGTADEKSDEAEAVIGTLRKLRAREFIDAAPNDAPVVTARLERIEGPPIEIAMWAIVDGSAQVRVGDWFAKVAEAQVKDLLDDVRAAVR